MEFITIIQNAFFAVNRVKGTLSKALLFHFIIFMILEAVTLAELSRTAQFGIALISSFVYVLVAITTHRIILLGEGSVPGYGLFELSKRELKYVMYVIGLTLAVLPAALFAYIPLVGFVLYFSFMVWVWGRSSLVFPAVALNDDFPLDRAWSVTKGYNFTMIMVVSIYPLILGIPSYFVEDIPYGSFVNVLIYMVTTVFSVSALSMAYNYFVLEPRAMDKAMEG